MTAGEVVAWLSERLGRTVHGELGLRGRLDLYIDNPAPNVLSVQTAICAKDPLADSYDFDAAVVHNTALVFVAAIDQAAAHARPHLHQVTVTAKVDV